MPTCPAHSLRQPAPRRSWAAAERPDIPPCAGPARTRLEFRVQHRPCRTDHDHRGSGFQNRSSPDRPTRSQHDRRRRAGFAPGIQRSRRHRHRQRLGGRSETIRFFPAHAHDILSVVSWLRSGPAATEKIDLVGLAVADIGWRRPGHRLAERSTGQPWTRAVSASPGSRDRRPRLPARRGQVRRLAGGVLALSGAAAAVGGGRSGMPTAAGRRLPRPPTGPIICPPSKATPRKPKPLAPWT